MKKRSGAWGFILFGARRQFLLLLFTVIVGALSSAVSVYFAVAVKNVIDAATLQTGKLFTAVGILLGVEVATLALHALAQYLDTRLRTRLEMTYKNRLMKRLLKKDTGYRQYHSGDLLARFTGDASVVANAVASLLPMVVSMSVRIVGVFAMLFVYDPWFTAVLAVIGVLFLLINTALRKKMKKLHKRVQETDSVWRSYTHEMVTHLPIVRVFCAEKTVETRSEAMLDENLTAKTKRTWLHIFTGTGYGVVFDGAYLYTLIWGVFRLADAASAFTFGTLTAMLDLIRQVQWPLRNLSGVAGQTAGMVASAERLVEIENLPDPPAVKPLPRKQLEKYPFTLQASGLQFAYDREAVFEDADFCIEKGDFAVIVGASGIGKSTLFRMMLGELTPQAGAFSLTCHDKTVDVGAALRGCVGFVPQGNLIFSGTVRENIAFANPDATEADILHAAEMACAMEFIEELPEGLDTVIGERGYGLSEGQVQRLAVARAILFDAPILLLDEATAALDEAVEERLLYNLKTLGKTILLISHKQAARQLATRLLTVRDKTVTDKL